MNKRMTKQHLFFVSTPKGMEALLADELRSLNICNVKEARSGAFFEDGIEAAYRVCLWSRIANRVFLSMAQFPANSPEALYDGIKAIHWNAHMDATNTLAVDVNVSHSNITHNHYAALKIKDAVVDFFQESTASRPAVAVKQPDIRINAYIHRNEAQVYIDLSGDSLHLRGYRDKGSAAPLKENLAAAILMRAKWPAIAAQGGDFVDFMCGSGTLLIEAALMACDIAPGLYRRYFGFTGWKQHQDDLWQKLVDNAEQRKTKGLSQSPSIFGFDHHKNTIEKARHHVQKTGLESVIKIDCQDINDFKLCFSTSGLVALNPPYGKRLGQDDELAHLYQAIGNLLKAKFIHWQACVFTNSTDLAKQIGLRANKIHSLFNGALECKLLHFDVQEKNFFADKRLPGFIPVDKLSDNSKMLENRLKKNLKQLKRWAKKENIDCYRIYDADLPEYAVAIDLYHGDEQWVHLQEYEAPKSIDPKKARWRLREAITIARDVLQASDSQIFLKTRSIQKGDSQYEKLNANKDFHRVNEGACQFLVNFEDYIDTGLFLDHRPTRSMIAELSQGKSFLNLFAYTGSVTVHAAAGGASRTTTVDMSSTYLDWAKRNMALNKQVGSKHQYFQADCMEWLKNPELHEPYDLIFIDPPSFSNSKRMQQTLDIQRDHVFLIRQAMKLLTPNGQLIFSNNLRKFKLDLSRLNTFKIKDITHQTIPVDFKRRSNIHHCWILKNTH